MTTPATPVAAEPRDWQQDKRPPRQRRPRSVLRWQREPVRDWVYCHHCGGIVWAGEVTYVAMQGRYVTHACEPCHMARYGPLVA